MTTPSTANSKDPGGNVLPVMERGATGSGGTHSVVKGEAAPRLPHERDESSDSGTGAPSDVMKKAADDLLDGHSDVPRGPKTQEQYSELTGQAQREAEPQAESPSNPTRPNKTSSPKGNI